MNIFSWGIKMRFLKYWWRRFITLFKDLFKKTQKEQDLDAPAPLKEDLDAPAPANKKNIGGNNMGNFWGPKTPEECQQEIEKHEQKMKEDMAKIKIKEMAKIKDLEKKKLELENKEGVAPIKPVGQEKVLSSNISPISMRSNNDNSNWIDPNDLNNTFEYQNVDKKALNAMGTKIKQDVKQEIKKEMDDRFAESTNNMNNLKEQVNKNTEDMKEVKKDIKDIKEEQINIKAMLANQEKMLEKMEEDRKKSEENQKTHDELMAALWNKLDEWNGIKKITEKVQIQVFHHSNTKIHSEIIRGNQKWNDLIWHRNMTTKIKCLKPISTRCVNSHG